MAGADGGGRWPDDLGLDVSTAPLVVALGGNAIAPRGQSLTAPGQQEAIARAADALAPIASHGPLVITHGNGPQVGMLARAGGWPLDVLDAETEGMLGYALELELGNRLPGQPIASLLTMVVVASDDPAFTRPTKPIGPILSREEADRVAASSGAAVAPDGSGWRRVVASPEPRAVVQLGTVRALLDTGHVVICAGGGGIPVVEDAAGQRRGVEAVVDKDLVSCLLAIELDVAALILLTDVDGVFRGWGTPDASLLTHATTADLRAHSFEAGTMGPKVEAACRFAEATGRVARIGALRDATAVIAGAAGTAVARRPGT